MNLKNQLKFLWSWSVGTFSTDDLVAASGSWNWDTPTTYVCTGFTLDEITTYDPAKDGDLLLFIADNN